MTRKDFKILAKSISEVTSENQRKVQCYAIGKVCQSQNELFNWNKWRKACNVVPDNKI